MKLKFTSWVNISVNKMKTKYPSYVTRKFYFHKKFQVMKNQLIM